MWDKKLYFDVCARYKTIIKENKRALSGSNDANWCHMSDVFQTVTTDKVDVYKLKELVKMFNLSSDLI
ncbi:MAG: hypothetical protein WBO35_04880 [Candidatus Saccharimonadales bacterium]